MNQVDKSNKGKVRLGQTAVIDEEVYSFLNYTIFYISASAQELGGSIIKLNTKVL